jgi:Holliday junction resolvase RusA-like endonuclease
VIEFTVYGKPQPQGSTRAFTPKGWSRPIITTDNAKLKPWRQQIADTALTLGRIKYEKETPVAVTLNFYFAKPASTSKKRLFPIVKPDIDKIARSFLDAITGVLITDDSQVVALFAVKHYDAVERVDVKIAAVGLEIPQAEQLSMLVMA